MLEYKSPTFLEHRRPFVEAFAEGLLFHERFAEPHVHAAFDLALDQQRVDRATYVVSDPYLVYVQDTGAPVGVEIDDASRVAVGRAGADTRALVRTGDLWRRVAARAGQRAEACLSQH